MNRRLYVWLLGSGKDDGTGGLSGTTFRMLSESMSATLDDEDDEVALSRMDSDAQRRYKLFVVALHARLFV